MRNEYISLIEKMAKDSSYTKDFLAGIDPTGVRTFRNALGNEKKHTTHKAVGNLGGFIGGAAGGVALPAAMTAGASALLKNKNPGLARNLKLMSKGSLEAVNPKKLIRYAKSMKPLSEFEALGSKVLKSSNNIMSNLDEVPSSKLKKPSISDIKELLEHPSKLDDLKSLSQETVGDINRLRSNNRKLQELGSELSNKYFNGERVGDGAQKALTALTTAGTAVGGGMLNASSAEMQYNTARNTKKMLDGSGQQYGEH